MSNYKTINLIEVERYFDGIEYPADKQEIIDTAEVNGAPEEVINILVEIVDLEYTNPESVDLAISAILS